MTSPTLFDPPAQPPPRTFAAGEAVWCVVDDSVLPARVMRCYCETVDPFMAGERILVKLAEQVCPLDTFATLVFAEREWKAAKAKAAE